MQTPPSDFSRPPENYGGSTNFSTDKTVGIILMVLAALGVLAALLVVLGGSVLGAAAASSRTTAGAGAAVVGGAIAFVGIIILLLAALNFAVGYGIMGSKRWAFMTGLILNVIGVVINLLSLNPSGIFSMLIGIGTAVYCYMRISGKYGPTPIG